LCVYLIGAKIIKDIYLLKNIFAKSTSFWDIGFFDYYLPIIN